MLSFGTLSKFPGAGILMHKPVKRAPGHCFYPLGALGSQTRLHIPLCRLGSGLKCWLSGIPHWYQCWSLAGFWGDVCLEKCLEVAFAQLAWVGRGVAAFDAGVRCVLLAVASNTLSLPPPNHLPLVKGAPRPRKCADQRPHPCSI